MVKRIAVIGGGPKAAALCAKAQCLNGDRRQLQIVVFEKLGFGSAWSGRWGYTDGDQRLCTPAERDVGFPYEEGLLNAQQVEQLYAEFSWGSYLVRGATRPFGYREWVDRGRKSPTHRDYARYVAWVLRQTSANGVRREVTGLGHDGKVWSVHSRRRGLNKTLVSKNFDGVVITGPGPALKGFERPDDPRIVDGRDFWLDPNGYLKQAEEGENPVVIAGSGGTAAAIAAKIVKIDAERPVIIIGNQAALFTRTESFFENALFTDEDAWRALKAADRIGVTQRLNRGVVWSSVSDVLSQSRNVKFQPGRVRSASIKAAVDDAPEELRVEVETAEKIRSDPASLVIDAAGFDPWWFVELLPEPMRRRTRGIGAKTKEEKRRDLTAEVDRDLSLDLGAPGLHVPILSLAQGPGFASLMALGSMSERILQAYV